MAFTFSLPRVAALITNEKKVDGKLVEIAYDFGDCNSMTMLIAIRCRPPVADRPCGRHVIWRTEDLYAKLPKCRTVREFAEKLVCSRCGRKGWLEIVAAGR